MPDRVQVDGGPGQQVVGKVSQGYESGFGEVVQHEEEKEKPKDVVELITGIRGQDQRSMNERSSDPAIFDRFL